MWRFNSPFAEATRCHEPTQPGRKRIRQGRSAKFERGAFGKGDGPPGYAGSGFGKLNGEVFFSKSRFTVNRDDPPFNSRNETNSDCD